MNIVNTLKYLGAIILVATAAHSAQAMHNPCNTEYAAGRLLNAIQWCQNLAKQDVPYGANTSLGMECVDLMTTRARREWERNLCKDAVSMLSEAKAKVINSRK